MDYHDCGWTKDQQNSFRSFLKGLCAAKEKDDGTANYARNPPSMHKKARDTFDAWFRKEWRTWNIPEVIRKVAEDLKVLPLHQMADQGSRRVSRIIVPV